jgi:hypothetical protein
VTDAASGEPASEATAGLIDRVYEAINARDVEALALISVPGFEWRDPDACPAGAHPRQRAWAGERRSRPARLLLPLPDRWRQNCRAGRVFDRPEAEDTLRRT